MTTIDKAMLGRLRERLEERRRQLVEDEGAQVAHEPEEADQARVGRLSRLDALQRQAVIDEAQRRRRVELTRVSAALERMDEGQYGVCRDCGREIDVRRLEVDPAAERCIDCARAAERR